MIQETLKVWHGMFESGDLSKLPTIVHPQAVFRSPVAHTPYVSNFALCLAINTVYDVFEDFEYHREFLSEDGSNAVLEFSAKVGGKSLKGIDMIRVDPEGLITEFEVMIRPMSGLQALAEEMGQRIGGQLAALKPKS